VSAGFPPQEFWASTPAEISSCMTGATDRRWRDLRERQALTYSLAALITTGHKSPKKFPKFDKAFPDQRKRRAQTPDEMLAAVRMFARPKRNEAPCQA
jgi:predicted small lipoprotein YifL